MLISSAMKVELNASPEALGHAGDVALDRLVRLGQGVSPIPRTVPMNPIEGIAQAM